MCRVFKAVLSYTRGGFLNTASVFRHQSRGEICIKGLDFGLDLFTACGGEAFHCACRVLQHCSFGSLLRKLMLAASGSIM